MTKLTMEIKISNHLGQELILGPGKPVDITKVTGLESTEYDVSLVDFAQAAGAGWTGTKIKPRPIHIEGSFRSAANNEANRDDLTHFFNPNGGFEISVTLGEKTLRIIGLLEGWNLKDQKNLDARVAFVADFICPDPFFYGPQPITMQGGGFADNPGDVPTAWTSHGPRMVTNTQTGAHFGVTSDAPGTVELSTEPDAVSVLINYGGTVQSGFRYLDRTSTPFLIPVGGCYLSTQGSGEIVYNIRYLGI